MQQSRYAHFSPRYLADEVKTLNRFPQEGKSQTKPDGDSMTTSDHEDQNPPGNQEDEKQ
jgi:hypothetical protein